MNISHKEFTLQLIQSLIDRSRNLIQVQKITLRSQSNLENPQSEEPLCKRPRILSSDPRLPESRKKIPLSLHAQAFQKKQRFCIYCCLLNAERKKRGETTTRLRSVQRICYYCQVYL